ncbi:MAG: phosphoribosylamine--glycine ligase [Bacteriovoracaceae bacterium]|nr:phosphoribosylamine--glycine ligase [Bacteriovoracaceae bacterium]
MNIYIVGNGGRESALSWKLAQSPEVQNVFLLNHPAAALLDKKIHSLNELDSDLVIDLVVIGPEAPLSKGEADLWRSRGIPTVGPSQSAAQLESSKIFAKEIMHAAGVPTARYESFKSSVDALRFLEDSDWEGFVIKVDGLASGKGVIVAKDKTEAAQGITGFFDGSYLNQKFERILIEEKLIGDEISAFSLCHHLDHVFIGAARDHKRLLAGDRGPNTGGMGCLSLMNSLSQTDIETINSTIFAPILIEMNKRAIPFEGFLFAGLMQAKDGFKVLEFNVRLGDPETQVLLPQMEDDFLPWIVGCANGKLPKVAPKYKNQTSIHYVLASQGYPTDPVKGAKLNLAQCHFENALVIPASVKSENHEWIANGGRVLGVSVLAPTLSEARALGKNIIQFVQFDGAQWREDIGERI